MRTLITCLALWIISGSIQAQTEQFRVDFNHVAIFLSAEAEWSEWFDAPNTFVINANDNNDVIHYRGDGNVVVYRNLGGLESDVTETGDHYQILNMLDEDGDQISFHLFDNISIGVKLISSDGMIQFSNF
jgi:hypothetical protein